MRNFLVMYCAAVTLVACGGDGDSTPTPDAAVDPDPLLDLQSTAAPGSLDDLHERIIAQRCSGQPGLCHNGQFEPNLSTPALTYAYLVNRPGIERGDRLRVKPGDSAGSFFIDKIRNRNGVLTQMPLGAEPLEEADVAAIEKWIDDGALRAPGAEPAPVLNNPPRRPEIAVFDNSGTRLDTIGPVTANPGSTLVLRHSVHDFETPDNAIPFAAVVLSIEAPPASAGLEVVLDPAAVNDKQLGVTTFDDAAPQGKGDLLNYRFTWNIPASNLQVRNPADNAITTIPDPSGLTVRPLAVYIDGATPGIIAIEISPTTIGIN
jgi:hypothetical protein